MKSLILDIETVMEPVLREGCHVISVVGSGGKTTLIKKTALHYANRFKIGVAASTKMFLPDETWNLNNVSPRIQLKESETVQESVQSPIVFYGEGVNSEGKLCGLTPKMLNMALKNRQLMLIEADGSKHKPLKGWTKTEPVILDRTDLTIGILPMHCIGQQCTFQIVHRMPEFTQLTGVKENEHITMDAYEKIINDKHGLFQYAKGRRLLLLNHITDDYALRAAVAIQAKYAKQFDWIIIGDV